MVCVLVLSSVWAAVEPRLAALPPERVIDKKGHGLMARAYRLLLEERYLRAGLFGGTVVELTDETVTVRWHDFRRTFFVSPTLASERVPLPRPLLPGRHHRLSHLRVGDRAGFEVVPTPRGYVILAMGICRRPGGTIPPGEDEELPEHCRPHNIFNACQAVEEKVLPRLERMLARVHR
jgi:hypothetical protein